MLPLLSLLLLATARAQALQGQTLKVTTAAYGLPFMVKYKDKDGADRFEGILADLVEELATDLGFSYNIQQAADSKYGTVSNSDGSWSGMVGEVMRGEADIAAADLTITSAREAVVDFTHPFMTLGLGMLTTRSPRGLAPRFETLEDLAGQEAVTVGTFKGGSTMNQFKNSLLPAQQTLWRRMEENWESTMVSSNTEGVDKVLAGNGNHVHIMETPMLEYTAARNCALMKAGETFNKKSYGLALPSGSPHREALSQGILRLQESGRMKEILDRWIKLPNTHCIKPSRGFLDVLQGFF